MSSAAAPVSSRQVARPLSDRTRRAYEGDWDLFTDWCAATGHQSLPASPETVAVYLDSNLAAPATQARRVAAINHYHARHGQTRLDSASAAAPDFDQCGPRSAGPELRGLEVPGRDPAIIDALRAARGLPSDVDERDTLQSSIYEVLRLLPRHGWPAGLFGRRDRCLLVLSRLAGLTHRQLQGVNSGDVEVDQRRLLLRVRDLRGATEVRRVVANDADPRICASCIYLDWHAVLAAAAATPALRPLRQALFESAEMTAESPHRCRRPPRPITTPVPLFQAADPHGYLVDQRPMSRRAISAITGAASAGRPLTHPALDALPAPADVHELHADPQGVYESRLAVTAPVPDAGELRANHHAAIARRRGDQIQLADITDVLHRLDNDIETLNYRIAALTE